PPGARVGERPRRDQPGDRISEPAHEVARERPASRRGGLGGRPVPVGDRKIVVAADLLQVKLELAQKLAVPRPELRAPMRAEPARVSDPSVAVVPVRLHAPADPPRLGGRDLARRLHRVLQIQYRLNVILLLLRRQVSDAHPALHRCSPFTTPNTRARSGTRLAVEYALSEDEHAIAAVSQKRRSNRAETAAKPSSRYSRATR